MALLDRALSRARLATPWAQAVRRASPPPEVRAVFDALLNALNGGSEDAWEAFAQARFSPSFLQKQPNAERAQLYRLLVDRFGAIQVDQVRRQGPDAPLQMMVKGSKADGESRSARSGAGWHRDRRRARKITHALPPT